MTDLLATPLAVIGASLSYSVEALMWSYVLWLFYLAVMTLKRARDADTLSRAAYALGMPILVTGYAIDFGVNVVVLSVVMLELPRETTVTARLKRHKYAADWRGRLARWIAAHLLDAFDPSGRHI